MSSNLSLQQEINNWEELRESLLNYEADIQWYPMTDKNDYRKYTRFIKTDKKKVS